MKRKIAMLILCLTALACAFSLSACSETKSLTIYVDGEVYQTIEFEGTEFVDLPALAERLGYEFIGWQLDGGDIIVDGRINADQADSSQSIHAVWRPKTYTISYDMQGLGEIYDAPSTYFISDSEIYLPNAECISGGYVFEGWQVNGEGAPILNYVIQAGQTGNLNLVACWSKNQNIPYSIELYYEEIDRGYYIVNSFVFVGEFEQFISIRPEDYVSDLSSLDCRELNADLSVLSGVIPSEREPMLELKIYYKLKDVSVHVDFNGGKYGFETEMNFSVKYGERVGSVPQPTKAGYNLVGYYDQYGTYYTKNQIKDQRVYDNLILTAYYQERHDTKYSVNIYKENIDGTYSLVKTNSLEGTTGELVMLENNYILHECSIDSPNHTYNALLSIVSGTINADGSLALNIYYSFIKVTATFDANGGEFENGQSVISTTLKKGQILTFPQPTREGFTFAYWEEEGSSIVDNEEYYDIHRDTTFVACWEADTVSYTVKYFVQNLDGSYEEKGTVISQGKSDSTPYFSAPDYITSYMHFDEQLSSPRDIKIKADGSTIVEVYYSLNYYTIFFDGNGGQTADGQTKVRILVRHGSMFNEQYPEFIREHYVFDGWNHEFDQPITQDMPIKAIWTAIQYKITYELDGGDNDGNLEYIRADYSAKLSDATKKGYEFLGWTVDGIIEQPTKLINLSEYGLKEYTVKANFKVITYTITYVSVCEIYSNPNPTTFTIEDDIITLIPLTNYDEGYTFKQFAFGGYEVTQIDPSRAADITIRCDFEKYTLGEIQLDEIEEYKNGHLYRTMYGNKYLFDATKAFVPEVLNATCIDSEGNSVDVSVSYPADWSWPNKAESVTFVATSRGETVQRKIEILPLGEADIKIYEYNSNTELTMYEIENYSGYEFYSNCLGLVYDIDESTYTKLKVSNVEYYYRPVYEVDEYVKVDEITKSGEYKFAITFTNLAGGNTVYERVYRVWGEDSFIITYDKNITNIRAGELTSSINLKVNQIYGGYPVVSAQVYSGEFKAGSKCRFKITISEEHYTANSLINYKGLKVEFITDEYTVYGMPTMNVHDGLFVYNEDYTTYFEAFDTFNNPLEISFSISNGSEYLLYNYVEITATATDAAGNVKTMKKTGYVSYKEFECSFEGRVVRYVGTSDTVVFPDGALYICKDSSKPMFADPTAIKKIVVPNSVVQFSLGVFSECTALEELSIPFLGSVMRGAADLGTQGGSFFNLFTTNKTDKAAGIASIPDTLKKLSVTKTLYTLITNNRTYGLSGQLKNIEELHLIISDDSYPNSLGGSNKLKKVVLDHQGVGASTFENCTALTEVEFKERVNWLGNGVFSGCTSLKSITLPAALTSIGENAFSGCTSLESIDLSHTLITSIGKYAFSGCTALEGVILPSTVTQIGEYAFKDCVSLAEIPHLGGVKVIDKVFVGCTGLPSTLTIPTGFTSATGAFSGLTQIKEITFEDGVTEVSGVAEMFTDMPDTWRLEKVVIPSSVNTIYHDAFKGMPVVNVVCNGNIERIYSGAFMDCAYLTSVDFNGYVKIFGNDVFKGCVSLTEINLVGTESIGSFTFYGCTALESVDLGNCLTYLGESTFENCGKLTQIELPSTLTCIGSYAFKNTDLQSLTLTEGIEEISSEAFANCTALTEITIPSTLTTGGFGAFRGCVNIKEVTVAPRQSIGSQISNMFNQIEIEDLYLPDGLVEIGNNAFYNLYWLEEIVIPSTVTSIGQNAFTSCRAPIIWENPTITTFTGNTFNLYFGETITIPKSIKIIGELNNHYQYSVFENCSSVIDWGESQVEIIGPYSFKGYLGTSITIPESVVEIKDYAFKDAINLQNISINGNVTLGNYVFDGAVGLQSVSVDGNVSLGNYVFNDAVNLQIAYLGGNVKFGSNVFNGCENLVEIHIGEGLQTLNASYVNAIANLKEVYLPASLTTIEDNAFSSSKIQTVVVAHGSNLQSIGKEAFYKSSLISFEVLSMASGVSTTVGERAFNGCTNLTSVLLPSASSFGDYCFTKSTSLRTISTSNSLTSVGISCFASTAIESITLSGITELPNYLFNNCTALKTVKLNEGLKKICDDAFNGCTSLLSIELPSTVNSLTTYAFRGCYADIIWISPTISEIRGFSGYLGDTINIPSSATTILADAINGFKGDRIIIPASVVKIYSSAFRNYTGIISWEENSAYTKVDKGAFANCSATIYLPATAVLNSDSLEYSYAKISWLGSPSFTTFDSYVFRNFEGELTVPSSITIFNSNAFHTSKMAKINFTSLEQLVSMTFISSTGHPGYVGCEMLINGQPLTEIDLNESDVVVGKYAFYKQNPTKLVLGDNAVINAWAFYECSSLETVEIGNNAVINNSAFSECKALETVAIGNNAVINNSAFNGCTAITELDLTNATLDAYAFSGCASLTKVNLIGVNYVDDYPAFENCPIKTVMFDYTGNLCENTLSDKSTVETIYVATELYRYLSDGEAKMMIDFYIDRFGTETTEVYFYSENQPTNSEYKFWHYNASGEVEIWQTV